MTSRILMIVTSWSELGDTGKKTGFYVLDLAVLYLALVDAGFEVTLASTCGGYVPMDPYSYEAYKEDPVVFRFLADEVLSERLNATPKASEFDGAEFDAVVFPGGHGAMFDLPEDEGVTRAVERAFAAKKLIASVAHGAVGLVTAKHPDGQSIVKDLRVTAFTNEEEYAVNLAEAVPFMLEARLRDLGGRFEGKPVFQAFAIRDGQLITGQNPASSHRVAQLLIEALRQA